MDPAAWERVKELFLKAVEEGPSVLEGLDREVREQVEVLLRGHREAPPEAAPEGPGAGIGPYKLLQQIGEGGFGVVYMAEQTEPVRRKVALKIIKLGMDTRQVVARFEAERQALALMDHPHIAKVLDGGATAAGRPYFVMELVKGVPITEYCDQARVDTAGRLELFQQVCHAVQHAHQKGIIHRDLKPSNVLVTLHDGVPVPKVIDFGIAKATDRRLTEKTLFTEFRQMIGTPDYMAPEQAEMSGLDVDTRADVYSLGVLLYELLTGTRPFDLKTLLDKGYGEILRTIREVDPPRPSTRVSTMGDALVAVAARRHTPPGVLGRILRGDLDRIVMKALEKDRQRRYESADGLATDVARYLRDEPVLAVPPSALYRARKYVRRHRAGVAAAATVLSALVVSGGLAFAGMRKAEADAGVARVAEAERIRHRDAARDARALEEEQRGRAEAGAAGAERETRRANAVLGLVDEMLGSADPHATRGQAYTVRQLLDDFDRGLGARLDGQPEVEAAVRTTMGRAYLGLGLPEKAEPHVEAALRLRAGGDDAARADALAARARLEHDRLRYGEAAATAREVVAIRRRTGGDLAAALADLADDLRHVGRLDEAEEAAREALALRRAEPRADAGEALSTLALVLVEEGDLDGAEALLGEHRSRAKGLGLGTCLAQLAAVRSRRGDAAGALALQREAFDVLRGHVGEDHPALDYARIDLASMLLSTGNLAEAEPLLEGVVARGRAPAVMPLALTALGQVRMARGDLAGAEARFREALALARAAGGHPQHMGHALLGLANVLFMRGDRAGADETMREMVATLSRSLGEDHPGVGEALGIRVTFLVLSGDPAAAKALAYDAVRRHRDPQLLALAGGFLVEDGRHAEAEPLLRECLAMREKRTPDAWSRYSAMSLLGASLAGQGRYAEAEPLLVEGYEKMSPPMPFLLRRREARERVVKLYEAWGKPEKAAEWRAKP